MQVKLKIYSSTETSEQKDKYKQLAIWTILQVRKKMPPFFACAGL